MEKTGDRNNNRGGYSNGGQEGHERGRGSNYNNQNNNIKKDYVQP